VITHVFHDPAFGSIRPDWAKAQLPDKSITAQAFLNGLGMLGLPSLVPGPEDGTRSISAVFSVLIDCS
jgi:hypothetical protein